MRPFDTPLAAAGVLVAVLTGLSGCGDDRARTSQSVPTTSSAAPDPAPDPTPTETTPADDLPPDDLATEELAGEGEPGDSEGGEYGVPAGTGHVSIEDAEGRTAEVQLRWYDAAPVDPDANPDSDCQPYGSAPTWDPAEAWLGMRIEAEVTNTTDGFDWPDGYGGSLSAGQLPDVLNFCQDGDVVVPPPNTRIWIGSHAMDGSTSGITWWASSERTPDHPDGDFAGVVEEWAAWHWYFPDAVDCTVDGTLAVVLEDGTCEVSLR